MQVHGYLAEGGIELSFNGERLIVPDDMSNRHRQLIAEWETTGNAIPSYSAPAPSTNPGDHPLTMRQLRLGLVHNGFPVDFIMSAISAIPDASERAVATIWYEESTVVAWDHPMTQTLMSAGGIDQAAAMSMWLAAKDLDA